MDASDTTTVQPVTRPLVGFNLQSTLGSPFLWIAVGAAIVLLIQYQTTKKRTFRRLHNVTDTGE